MMLGILKSVAVETVAGAMSKRRLAFSGTAIGLWAASFIVFIASFGFAVSAFYLYLAQSMEPLMATMIVSAALFGLVIVLGVVATCLMNRQRNVQHESDEELKRVLMLLTQQGYDEIKEPIQDNPALALGVSALAGFIASRYL